MPPSLAALRAHDELRQVARLAAPAVAHSLLQTLIFLLDRLMLGHHSESALAAMQFAGPLVWSVYSVCSAFTVGTTAVVGRAVGAGDPRGASEALRASLALALAVGAVVAALGSVALDAVLGAFGRSDPAARAAAHGYLRVVLPSMPLLFVGLTAVAALQAAGNTRTPFAIAVAANALKVVLNWALIFGHLGAPRLGARGAGIADAVVLSFEALLGVLALASPRSPVRLSVRSPVALGAGVRRVLSVAWGAYAEKAIYHVGYLGYVAFIVGLGGAAMAANQALISIESVCFLTGDGCAVAAGALCAQNLGAGRPDRARRAAWIAAALAAGVLGACALVFVAVPGPLIRAFRDDPRAVAMGVGALRVAAVAQLPMAVAIVLAQAMRGVGATREALVVSFAGALVVRLAATFLFVRVLHLGLMGVWMGSTADWIVRALVYAARWRRGAWQRARV